MRNLIAVLVGVAVAVGFGFSGATATLGAHPFWAMDIGWIGGIAGAVALIGAFLSGVPRRWLRLVAVLMLPLAGVSAAWGKMRFAASYAEDAFAGQVWYFGWIAVAAALCMIIGALLMPKPVS
ncbi:hypothetical protein FHS89_000409 [Rubricella aquisinus]|uniref:Uncharacterized protein n=1 Tax=Rubricella aquisinus TaxID=2028108 RepID=A0A840WIT8_9RHOB|nr:hypothetical protein [Rubricella aquisinus]MBB5514411.1 hypothetical protein [Rubricella aquisinus]